MIYCTCRKRSVRILPFKAKAEKTHLIRLDSIFQSFLNTIPRNLPRHEIGEARFQTYKQIQDCDLQRIRGIGVDFIVRFDNEKASLF